MNFISRLCILLLSLSLSACFKPASPPTDAPANVTLSQVGDGLVVLNWDAVVGRRYWVFYNTGTTASQTQYSRILVGVKPPYVLNGLTNGTQYAFALTSSKDGSGVGPFSPVLTATPRLIGTATPWTIGTALGSNNLNSINLGVSAVENATNTGVISTYVAVGDAASIYYGTYNYPDAGGVVSWNPAASLPISTTTNLKSVVFNGTQFVAMGDDGTVLTSTDYTATSWVAATAIPNPPVMNSMAVGYGRYVAVGNGGAIYLNTSTSVTSAWMQETSGTTNDLYNVSFVNGTFFAVGAGGTMLTSTDGVTWTAQTTSLTDNLRAVTYGASTTINYIVGGGTSTTTSPGTYVVVGDNGAVASSPDGVNWTPESNPTTENFRSICYGSDQQFVAVGTNGLVAYSKTGMDGTWTTSTEGSQDLNSISPNLLYLAVGAAGTNASVK